MSIGISRSEDEEGGSYDEEANRGDKASGDSTIGATLDSLHCQIELLLLVLTFCENKHI